MLSLESFPEKNNIQHIFLLPLMERSNNNIPKCEEQLVYDRN